MEAALLVAMVSHSSLASVVNGLLQVEKDISLIIDPWNFSASLKDGQRFNSSALLEDGQRFEDLLAKTSKGLRTVASRISETTTVTFRDAVQVEAIMKVVCRLDVILSFDVERKRGGLFHGDDAGFVMVSHIRRAAREVARQVQEIQEAICSMCILENLLATAPVRDVHEFSALTSELDANGTQTVIQQIDDPERPISPDPTDSIISELMWTQMVELRIVGDVSDGAAQHKEGVGATKWVESEWLSSWSAKSDLDQPQRPSDFGEVVFIVKFSRCGDKFKSALHESETLETVRSAMKSVGHPCFLERTGASIFVYPAQYVSIMEILPKIDLRPHHVVVSDAFLPLVYSAIATISSKHKIKPSSLQPFALVDGETDEVFCMVERGFYNACPQRCCGASVVTQSTSEAPPNRVLNVRRLTPDLPDFI